MKFLQTSEFRKLWVIANTEAHDALVAVVEGKPSRSSPPTAAWTSTCRTSPPTRAQAIGLAGLDLYDKTRPAAIVHQKFVIVKPKSLGRIRWAATTLKRLAIVLPVAALVLAGLALAISRERRRTVFWLGGGLTAGAIAGLVLVAFGRRYYLDNIVGPDVPGDAARALYDTLLRNLRFDLELAILAGVLVAGGAALAGPSRVAVGIRARSLAVGRRHRRQRRGPERVGELGRGEQGNAPHDHLHLRADLPRHRERPDAHVVRRARDRRAPRPRRPRDSLPATPSRATVSR